MSKKLLLVDDEEDLLEVIQFGLESLGYQFVVAVNAPTALEVLKAESVDFVVSDMRMAGGDGLALLEGMNEQMPVPPGIVFLSGHSDYPEQELLDKGAKAFLKKPISMDELDKVIKSYIN